MRFTGLYNEHISSLKWNRLRTDSDLGRPMSDEVDLAQQRVAMWFIYAFARVADGQFEIGIPGTEMPAPILLEVRVLQSHVLKRNERRYGAAARIPTAGRDHGLNLMRAPSGDAVVGERLYAARGSCRQSTLRKRGGRTASVMACPVVLAGRVNSRVGNGMRR